MLTRATASQHDRLLACIEEDARRLAERLGEGRLGAGRIAVSAVLAETLLAVAGDRERVRAALAQLDRDLDRFVLADGTPA
ncbi:hypothetical protein J8J40_24995, partial [Mycobacterium tuberculosis]|nr:hypothetical protein [Mycobacterium tuberculosis]